MKIDVILAPFEIEPSRVLHRAVAVIDVFRATSCIITAIDSGASKVVPVIGVNEAFELKEHFAERGENVLLGGEREAILIDGFDKDNSPFSYMGTDIKGRTIVMSTTNGTHAIQKSRLASNIFIAAFINYTAVSEKLIATGKDILIVCAGNNNLLTLEDMLCAGAIVDKISSQMKDNATLTDSAWCSMYLYNNNKDDIKKTLDNCTHYKHIISLGMSNDVDYCLKTDTTTTVPILDDNFNIIA